MERSPDDLMADFLNRAFPLSGPPRVKRVMADDLLKIFFGQAKRYQEAAALNNFVWSEAAVQEVDDTLETIADLGDYEPDIDLSPEGATELHYRWTYAIMALALENQSNTNFHLLLPEAALEGIQNMAAILFVLAGPARSYPREVLHKR